MIVWFLHSFFHDNAYHDNCPTNCDVALQRWWHCAHFYNNNNNCYNHNHYNDNNCENAINKDADDNDNNDDNNDSDDNDNCHITRTRTKITFIKYNFMSNNKLCFLSVLLLKCFYPSSSICMSPHCNTNLHQKFVSYVTAQLYGANVKHWHTIDMNHSNTYNNELEYNSMPCCANGK